MNHTWICHRDEQGNQFDLRSDTAPTEGQTPVTDYPTHYGPWGRPAKAALDLRKESAPGYSGLRKAELLQEIERRNHAAVEAGADPVIEITKGDTVADLISLLEANDEPQISDPSGPDAGETPTTTDADLVGQEQE